jgi:hypothetical protein
MAGFRRAQSGQRAQQGALAGAIAADDAPAFALAYLPFEVGHQLALAGAEIKLMSADHHLRSLCN